MITFKNCNNIEYGEIDIQEKHLNIKYGFNGTGKTTISKAIVAKTNDDEEALLKLTPFKDRKDGLKKPEIDGLDKFKSVLIFNDNYVNSYVFQKDELLKNSFEIFVKSKDYDEHMEKIDELIQTIVITFRNDEEIQKLITDLQEFLNSYGSAKNNYSASSLIGKGLGKGNKLESIPAELSRYKPFLVKADTNVPWLKWQLDGKKYWVDGDVCPYCASNLENKDEIEKIAETYDYKTVDSLNKILKIFDKFKDYFSESTNLKIAEIAKNISGISKEKQLILQTIREQAVILLDKLIFLKDLSFNSFKKPEEIQNVFEDAAIDIEFFDHFNSSLITGKINRINENIENVKKQIGQLRGEIAQQQILIKKTIKKYSDEINSFLKCAGYKYEVNIEESGDSYKLKLHHEDISDEISGGDEYLSYGERNAFALALFMYSALHENPDLIILDDPISSFDGNKKFAIINMLFMGSNSFNGHTVLLLTHDFNIVIDTIYNYKGKIVPVPVASFLTTNKNGVLSEKAILKDNIKSFISIASEKIESDIDIINKCVYLRRLSELENGKDYKWNMLSSLLHKYDDPTIISDTGERKMTLGELITTQEDIKKYLPDFDYFVLLTSVRNGNCMKELYKKCNSNYEKLQLFRIIFEGMDKKDTEEVDDVLKQFINKTFHIENDMVFQLDPAEYDTIPNYIIKKCDDMVDTYISKTTVS